MGNWKHRANYEAMTMALTSVMSLNDNRYNCNCQDGSAKGRKILASFTRARSTIFCENSSF